MTLTARLSRDGRRVLCGWNDRGRFTCPGQFGYVVTDGFGIRDVEFDPVYVQAKPLSVTQSIEAPLILRVRTYTAAKVARGQKPRPRRLAKAQDGTPVLVWHRWTLPILAPCLRCQRPNLVIQETLDSFEPSR